MKNFTNVDARQKAIDEVKKRFVTLGFKDGNSLSDEEIKDEKAILFWQNICDNPFASEKPIIVTFNAYSSEISARADNQIRSREVAVTVNFWCKHDLKNGEVPSEIYSFESEFNIDWEVELSNYSKQYDKGNYQFNYSLYKNFNWR